MLRTASRSSVARTAPRVTADAKLSLAEFLVSCIDLDVCVQRGLDWLAEHTGVLRSFCGIVDPDESRFVGVAEYGMSTAGGAFSFDLEDRAHALARVLASTEPEYFAPPVDFESPLGDVPFFAIPLRAEERARGLADGLLLISLPPAGLGPDIKWFVEIFGHQVARLRHRQTLAEAHFGRERTLLYDTLDAVIDPILITDPDGRLLLSNARAEKLFAAPEDASEGWRHAVAVNNMLFSAALAASMMEREVSRRELLLVDPIEGSDLLFELMSTAARDPRRGTAVVSILRNVTDLDRARAEIEESYRQLRAAQAEMRAERERLDLIIDSVADPIVVADANGDIRMMNAPAETLFTSDGADEEAQRRVRSNGAHFTSFVSNLLFLGADQSYRGSIALVDPPSGAHKPVEAVAGKILSEQGELTHVVTILHDLTETLERERLYEQVKQASFELEGKVHAATAELARQNELLRRQHLQLEQASQLKSQFLANMSHEFRTPLNVILGYTHMLLQDAMGQLAASQRKSLSRVDSNARHLLVLINDILDITRIEAGRMPLNVSSFKLPDLLREVTLELESLIKQSKLTVATDVPARFPLLETDRQKMKQIVMNLLSNALKFTQRGSVTIRAAHHPSTKMVSIAVVDTGIGIPEADQDRVFEDFQQLDPSPTRPHGGTGLGLAICRRLANMLEGRILLQSRLGHGSTFTLQVPRRLKRR